MNEQELLSIKVLIDTSHNVPQIANTIIKNLDDIRKDVSTLDKVINSLNISTARIASIVNNNLKNMVRPVFIDPKIESATILQALDEFDNIYEQVELIATAWIRFTELIGQPDLAKAIDAYGSEIFNLKSQLPTAKQIREDIFNIYQYQTASRNVDAQRYTYNQFEETMTILVVTIKKLKEIILDIIKDDNFSAQSFLNYMQPKTPAPSTHPFLDRNQYSPRNVYSLPRLSLRTYKRSYTKGVI